MKRRIEPLSAIQGQDAAIQALLALHRRGGPIPPLLLHGPDGVGKRTAALAFAAALVCRKPRGADACGACAPCRRVADASLVTDLREGATAQDSPLVYPDIGFVSVPRQKTRISVLQARDIALSLAARPFELARRIYIVEPADKLNPASANALLKVLEEPPSYGVLILVTAAPWSLPLTVRSRLTAVRFRPLPQATVEQLLLARGLAPDEAALRAAHAAGRLSRATNVDPEEERKLVAAWTGVLLRLAQGARAAELAAAAGAELGADPESAIAALDLLLTVLRDAAAGRAALAPVLLDESQADELAPLAEKWVGRLHDRPRLVDRLRREVEIFNRNPRLAIEGAVLAVAGVLRSEDFPA